MSLDNHDVSEHVASNGEMIPDVEASKSIPSPVWPELDADQKAEALAAVWPARLRFALVGATLLALLTSAASYRASDGVFDLRAGISLTLAGSFLASYFLVKTRGLSRRWLAPLGQITIALTLINLTACIMEQLQTGITSRQATVDPALVFLTLIVGSLWALRIHLSPVGFALGAALTAAILWAPWIALTEAPVQFSLTGLACLAVGAQMRWIGAERAYARYRRKVVWPRSWRGSVQAAVLRELSNRAAATAHDERPQPLEALAKAVDGERLRGSLAGLASALGGSESPGEQEDPERRSSLTKTADSTE